MKRRIFITISAIILILAGIYILSKYYQSNYNNNKHTNKLKNSIINTKVLKDGDIIFQTSLSEQSKAIQAATKSRYSHCGIIFEYNKQYYVIEAIQTVTATPIEKWIDRGENQHYVVKRLKNASDVLTPSILQKMQTEIEKFIGKKYDITFEWSDDKIYCSELVWKVYQRSTGMEIGKIQKLKDFDLSNQEVIKKIKERYGDRIPLNEPVVSPAAIFQSELLVTVQSN